MKKVLISILTIIFIISMITIVNAATGNMLISTSGYEAAQGDTFTVTLMAESDEKITGLQALLSYDTDKLVLESKTAATGYSDLSGDDTEIAIASTSNETSIKSGTLYTLTFKVLNNAALGEAKVKVTEGTLAVVNDSQEQQEIMLLDGSATVNIIANSQGGQQGNNPSGGTQTPNPDSSEGNNNEGNNNGSGSTNTPSGGNSGGSVSGSNVGQTQGQSGNSDSDSSSSIQLDDSSKDDKKLPQTGIEVISILTIATLTVFAVISYVFYKKYKNI